MKLPALRPPIQRFSVLLTVVAFFGVSSTVTPAAAKSGPGWHSGDVLSALALAKKTKKRVLLKFTASWCSVCKVLEKQVLNTPAGASLTKGMVALAVDFDAPRNRRFVEKYVVLGLPTTVVLKPDGAEAGRIMGFESRDSWIKDMKALKTGEVSVSRLEAQLVKHPSDPTVMRLLGQTLLERGNTARGQALLEQVTWLAPHSDAAAHGLFVLGRFFHRVKQEPETARHIWRELGARFPASDWAWGALWWYARAQAEIGRPLAGAFALEQRAVLAKKPNNAHSWLAMWASFVVKHKLKSRAPAALKAIAAVDGAIVPKQKAKLDALVPKLKGLK